MKEFLDKQWTKTMLSDFLQQLKETGSTVCRVTVTVSQEQCALMKTATLSAS